MFVDRSFKTTID